MSWFHTHYWVTFHPVGYPAHVKMEICHKCNTLKDNGYRGEGGPIIPHAFQSAIRHLARLKAWGING